MEKEMERVYCIFDKKYLLILSIIFFGFLIMSLIPHVSATYDKNYCYLGANPVGPVQEPDEFRCNPNTPNTLDRCVSGSYSNGKWVGNDKAPIIFNWHLGDGGACAAPQPYCKDIDPNDPKRWGECVSCLSNADCPTRINPIENIKCRVRDGECVQCLIDADCTPKKCLPGNICGIPWTPPHLVSVKPNNYLIYSIIAFVLILIALIINLYIRARSKPTKKKKI